MNWRNFDYYITEKGSEHYFESGWAVSNTGFLRYKNHLIEKFSKDKKGHPHQLILNLSNEYISVKICRIVALNFNENKRGLLHVKHTDGDICNNIATNLYWSGANPRTIESDDANYATECTWRSPIQAMKNYLTF